MSAARGTIEKVKQHKAANDSRAAKAAAAHADAAAAPAVVAHAAPAAAPAVFAPAAPAAAAADLEPGEGTTITHPCVATSFGVHHDK